MADDHREIRSAIQLVDGTVIDPFLRLERQLLEQLAGCRLPNPDVGVRSGDDSPPIAGEHQRPYAKLPAVLVGLELDLADQLHAVNIPAPNRDAALIRRRDQFLPATIKPNRLHDPVIRQQQRRLPQRHEFFLLVPKLRLGTSGTSVLRRRFAKANDLAVVALAADDEHSVADRG